MSLDTGAAQPVIAADGFVLRPLRQADTGLISFYAGDQRVALMTRSIPHPLDDSIESLPCQGKNSTLITERSEGWANDL